MIHNWYKKAENVYRGDTDPINLSDFDPDYGKELGSTGRGGPGIYFTTKEEDARSYGPHITNRNIQDANILSEQSPKFTYAQIERILKGIPSSLMETSVSNWDENFQVGKKMLIRFISDIENPVEQLMCIWSDIFSHQNAKLFMKLMTQNGIDGIAYPRPDSTHYVVYNQEVLK